MRAVMMPKTVSLWWLHLVTTELKMAIWIVLESDHKSFPFLALTSSLSRSFPDLVLRPWTKPKEYYVWTMTLFNCFWNTFGVRAWADSKLVHENSDLTNWKALACLNPTSFCIDPAPKVHAKWLQPRAFLSSQLILRTAKTCTEVAHNLVRTGST